MLSEPNIIYGLYQQAGLFVRSDTVTPLENRLGIQTFQAVFLGCKQHLAIIDNYTNPFINSVLRVVQLNFSVINNRTNPGVYSMPVVAQFDCFIF
jgi:hypothetical protein